MVKVKNPETIARLITEGSYEKKRIFSIVSGFFTLTICDSLLYF
jgi:hypothetical protein